MNEPLPHDHITPYGDPVASKKQQVAKMFDDIAGRYDRLNQLLSFGIHTGWRKKALRLLKSDHPAEILDVATGTGDLAIAAAKMLKPLTIVGIDISTEMLEIAKKKVEKERFNSIIQLQKGDSETINFAGDSFDAVIVAFGVRNFENLDKGLKEMLRVLKPGGRLVVLEFSRPRTVIFRSLYNLYMGKIAPEIARLFSKNKKAYQYLEQSARVFPERHAFIEILNSNGYSETHFKTLSAGICCIYTGRKL